MSADDKRSVKEALRGMLRRLSRPAATSDVPDPVADDPANSRTGTRVPICLEIDMEFKDDGTHVKNKTLDVSRGGAFVRTPQVRPPGTPVQVEMRIGSHQISLDAVVAHVVTADDPQQRTPGIGVEFDHVDEETDQMLDKLLSKYRKVAR